MRFFYVIYVHNEIIRTILDGIRLFADPTQKYSAHITVRGPYESEEDYTPDSFNKWNGAVLNTHIIITGIDTFFNTEQSTIFFKCEGDELKKLWWKKHFKNYTPHMTIYDKKDRAWANDIVNVFEDINIKLSFKVNSLDKLISDSKKSPKIQGKLFERLLYSYDYGLLEKILGTRVDNIIFTDSNKLDRLYYIEKLARILSNIESEERIMDVIDI